MAEHLLNNNTDAFPWALKIFDHLLVLYPDDEEIIRERKLTLNALKAAFDKTFKAPLSTRSFSIDSFRVEAHDETLETKSSPCSSQDEITPEPSPSQEMINERVALLTTACSYEEKLEKAPIDKDLFEKLVNLYFELCLYQQAIDLLLERLALPPQSPFDKLRMQYNLGCAYFSIKDYEKADEQFKEILTKQHSHKGALQMRKNIFLRTPSHHLKLFKSLEDRKDELCKNNHATNKITHFLFS